MHGVERDTKQLEMVAEDLVAHFLQRNDILVAKPKFDRQGVDLYAMLTAIDGRKLCRIQCKGRTLDEHTPKNLVEISGNHLSESFIAFLYIDDGDFERTHLFCFFKRDFKPPLWKERDGKWYLN